MGLEALNTSVGAFLAGRPPNGPDDGVATGVPGLYAYEFPAPTVPTVSLYVPIACLTMQGGKALELGSTVHHFVPGDTTIVSHDLPVTSRITQASGETPYRALVMAIDLTVLRSLYTQMADLGLTEGAVEDTASSPSADIASVSVGPAAPGFIDALARYFTLAEKPAEVAMLAPLIQRELHYRLLMTPHAAGLRRLLPVNSHDSRIGRSIQHMRQHFRRPLAVTDLARLAGMGVSSFHAHFRAITATTPLQYQKDLRLIEARRLLGEGELSVAATAYDVGYESATQFSREYARKFGTPPSRDPALSVGAA